jgi:hypothetical protein
MRPEWRSTMDILLLFRVTGNHNQTLISVGQTVRVAG